MTTTAPEGAAAPKTAPVYLVAGGDFPLEASAEVAWPHVIDFTSWQNYSSVEHISGPVGREGEVALLRKEEDGFEFPPYFTRTILFEPGSRVVWKTYPTDVPEGTGFFGIVDFRLDPVSDTESRFVWNVLYEFPVHHESEEELDRFREQQYENFAVLFASVWPKLRRQVSEGRP